MEILFQGFGCILIISMRQDSHPYNPLYDDSYFTPGKGFEEATYVFIQGNTIEQRIPRFLQAGSLVLGEIGFGTGLNLWVLMDHLSRWLQDSDVHQPFRLRYLSVEESPLDQESINWLMKPYKQYFPGGFLDSWITQLASVLFHGQPGWNHVKVIPMGWHPKEPGASPGQVQDLLELEFWLWYGQAKDMLRSLDLVFSPEPVAVDGWFLDGHDPKKNPEAWSQEVFQGVWNASISGTTLATYTASGQVKQGLRDQGFVIQRKKGFDKKHHMIVGHRP